MLEERIGKGQNRERGWNKGKGVNKGPSGKGLKR